ncbi:MAG: hypothetical protein AB7P21_11030 [Lautropia sp.]
MKMVFGLVGVVLLAAFLAPILIKLRGETALIVIACIGVAMAAIDMVQGVRALRRRQQR